MLWTLLSLPLAAVFDVRNVWADRQALQRHTGLIYAISRRHVERAIGRIVFLTLIMLIGLASLFTRFVAPTNPRGWLILLALLLLPVVIQLDAIRDHQLRREIRRSGTPSA